MVYIQSCSCAYGRVCLCIWLEFVGVHVHACVRPGVRACVHASLRESVSLLNLLQFCLFLAPGEVGGAGGSCTP